MKRINLDREDEQIQKFVQSLSVDENGAILELRGEPVVKVLPVAKTVDRARLKAAILKRRNESRQLNKDWEAVDREMWDRVPSTEE
jgi:hypothetical protein